MSNFLKKTPPPYDATTTLQSWIPIMKKTGLYASIFGGGYYTGKINERNIAWQQGFTEGLRHTNTYLRNFLSDNGLRNDLQSSNRELQISEDYLPLKNEKREFHALLQNLHEQMQKIPSALQQQPIRISNSNQIPQRYSRETFNANFDDDYSHVPFITT